MDSHSLGLRTAGAEGFELEVGPWHCLANKALVVDQYAPDFDAVGVPPLRALRIRRPAFLAAMEATSLQPVSDHQASIARPESRTARQPWQQR